ncbi:MAG: S41 family peptidase [Chlorobi bacterium]|nr:S41 family peptidase [Chlorobiota bacterium]
MIKRTGYTIFLYFIFLLGCNENEVVTPDLKDYSSDFNLVWATFDLNYPLFKYKNIDWDNSRSQFDDQFISITVTQRNNRLKDMLSVFKDYHVLLIKPSGDIIPTFVNQNVEANFKEEQIEEFTNSLNWHEENETWGWGVNDSVGYLRIASFNPSDIDTIAFASIMENLKPKKGIIIDLRKNSGGNLPVTRNIVAHFANEEMLVGYVLYRNGAERDDYAPEIPVVIAPLGDEPYENTIAVLIGRFCGSAGEIFAEALSQFGNVALIGDTTLGAVEAPSSFSLPDGTEYSVPIAAYLDVEHKPLEWKGVEPDIYIGPCDVQNSHGKDIVIKKALELINSKKKNRRKPEKLHIENAPFYPSVPDSLLDLDFQLRLPRN